MKKEGRLRAGRRGSIKGSFVRRLLSNNQEIPISLERALLLASEDQDFCEALCMDTGAALRQRGLVLRSSEHAMLAAMPRQTLKATVAQLKPKKQRNKAFAAAVAATVAGTMVFSSCIPATGGAGPEYDPKASDAGIDAGVDSGNKDGH